MKEEKIKSYLLENMETLKDVTRELISWNGCLDYLDYFENDEYFFNDMFFKNADEAVRAVCYGNYNYTDDLVKFNAYGNLESCSYYEYEQELKDNIDEIVENLLEEYENITIYDDKLNELLENNENEKED